MDIIFYFFLLFSYEQLMHNVFIGWKVSKQCFEQDEHCWDKPMEQCIDVMKEKCWIEQEQSCSVKQECSTQYKVTFLVLLQLTESNLKWYCKPTEVSFPYVFNLI